MIKNVKYNENSGLMSFDTGEWTAYYDIYWGLVPLIEDKWERSVMALAQYQAWSLIPESQCGDEKKYIFNSEKELKKKFKDFPVEDLKASDRNVLVLKHIKGNLLIVHIDYEGVKKDETQTIWKIIECKYTPVDDKTEREPIRKNGQSIKEYVEENKDNKSVTIEMLTDFCDKKMNEFSSLIVSLQKLKRLGFEYEEVVQTRPDLNNFWGITEETYKTLPKNRMV